MENQGSATKLPEVLCLKKVWRRWNWNRNIWKATAKFDEMKAVLVYELFLIYFQIKVLNFDYSSSGNYLQAKRTTSTFMKIFVINTKCHGIFQTPEAVSGCLKLTALFVLFDVHEQIRLLGKLFNNQFHFNFLQF